MALQWQPLDVPLGKGLLQRVDPMLLPEGALASVSNVQFDKIGRMACRPGYSLAADLTDILVPTNQYYSYNPAVRTKAGTLLTRGSALCLIDAGATATGVGSWLWELQPTAGKTDIRSHVPEAVCSRVYGSGSRNAFAPAAAYANGYYVIVDCGNVVADADKRFPGICATIRHDSGATIQGTLYYTQSVWDDVVPGAQAGDHAAQVTPIGNYLLVTWIDTDHKLRANVWDTVNTKWTSPTTSFNLGTMGATITDGDYVYDVCAVDGSQTLAICYGNAAQTKVTVAVYTIGASTMPLTVTADVGSGVTRCVCIATMSTGDISIGWMAGGGFQAASLNPATLAVVYGPVVIGFADDVWAAGIAPLTTNQAVITAQFLNGNNVSTVQAGWWNATAGTSVVNPVMGYVRLASKPAVFNNRAFCVVYPGPWTSDVGTDSGQVIVEIPPYGSDSTVWRPMGAVGLQETRARFGKSAIANHEDRQLTNLTPGPTTNTLVWGGCVASTVTDFARVAWCADFASDKRWQSADTPTATCIGGGVPSQFDGRIVHEHGFLTGPTLELSTSAGGAVPVGTYSLSAVVWWVDAQGVAHYSPPSTLQSLTIAGGTQTLAYKVHPPTLTGKVNHTVKLNCSLYCTEPNGQLLHLLETVSYAPASGGAWTGTGATAATAIGASFTLAVTFTSLTSKPQIYTSGGIVPHHAIPSCSVVIAHRGRVFAMGCEDPQLLYYSGELIPGGGVWFSQLFKGRIPVGEITAAASLDDKLVVFSKDRIYLIVGQGPNDTGGNNDFSNPEPIASSVGCIEPRSVVTTSDGIIFLSASGFYRLTRALQVEYIGAPVVDTLDAFPNVTSVRLVDDTEVRWTVTDNGGKDQAGRTLVYDTVVDQWTVWSPVAGVPMYSSAIANGTYYLLAASGKLYKETLGSCLDAGAAYTWGFVTGPIHLGGVQGFGRVRAARFIGTYSSPHTLTVTASYDYGETTQTPVVYSAAALTSYAPREQVRFRPSRQVCQAVAFTVLVTPDGTGTSAGCTLSGLQLEIGMKGGINRRIPDAATS